MSVLSNSVTEINQKPITKLGCLNPNEFESVENGKLSLHIYEARKEIE